MHLRKPFKFLTLFFVSCLLLGTAIRFFPWHICIPHCLSFPNLIFERLKVIDDRYCPVGRSFYSPDLGRRQPLGEGLESWRGFYQSIRPTQMGLSLNIGTVFMMLTFSLYWSILHALGGSVHSFVVMPAFDLSASV